MTHGMTQLCTLQKRNRVQTMTYTAGSGTPAVGQTVTGGTSHQTAVIRTLATGYIIAKTVSGTFTPGETITTATWSATLGTQTDYQNSSKEYEYYWTDDQPSIPCSFYTDTGPTVVIGPGQMEEMSTKVMLPPTVTVDSLNYRVYTTQAGFEGTYRIKGSVHACYGFPKLDHYELELGKWP